MDDQGNKFSRNLPKRRREENDCWRSDSSGTGEPNASFFKTRDPRPPGSGRIPFGRGRIESERGSESERAPFGRRREPDRTLFGNRTSERIPFKRGGRSQSESNRSEGFGRRFGNSMGFMFLENLLKSDAEEIVTTLFKEKQGFLQLLETNTSTDTIVLVVKILKKASSSQFSDTKYTVLQKSLNEKFINNLRTFIACLPTHDQRQKQTSSYFWKNPGEFWTNLSEICEDLLRTIPTFASKTLPMVLNSMKIYIPIIEHEHQIQTPDAIKQKVEKMLELIKILAKETEEKHQEDAPKEARVEPPDDFRQISVYPSPEEVVGGRGFLRENVVKGPYQNVNHYLDVQFRLLREDFVGPLREGIANYRSSGPSNQMDSVKVHKGVRFLNSETINEFYCLRVQFSTKKKKTNFENSKRFMYGSLLCFTRDDFKSLIFGKVAQRKIEDLQKGQLIVAFDQRINLHFNSDYLMVECSVYFEPYFHVLTVLKSMTQENFPLERYIIRVNPSVLPPEYLTEPDLLYDIEDHEFYPLAEWPAENFYNLNESQMVAFKAAITQEISVIQGPPGTGKTYLGLRVAETLLRNKDHWYDRTPMLVICFTNHALDQFLEGLIPCTDQIVRVGGQSKNSNLDKYNLRHKFKIGSASAGQRLEVERCLKEIKRISEVLEQIGFYNGVLSFEAFADAVPGFGNTWFARASRHEIVRWLLEGAEYGRNSQLQDHLNALQFQEELGNINIGDDDDVDVKNDNAQLDDASHFKFDTIFDEVSASGSGLRAGFFLITLKSMRDKLRIFEQQLGEFKNEPAPSLQHLIEEEKLRYQLWEMRQQYEYLKMQLAGGRKLLDYVEEPRNIDTWDPHNMRYQDRWNLYFYWLKLYRKREEDVLRMISQDFPEMYRIYEELREIEDVKIMKDALVVGMTTTSAARLRSSLQTLKNPIVIVEEAAEVLEAHIVTSITKHCKHLILIGDHKQLKPNTASYSIEKKFHLGISLFERMLKNNIHCYTLNVQHRMRPEISSLICPTIYDFLEDHPSVHHRPLIRGIDNCIFFIDHKHPEESDEGSSKTNYHEVTFFIALARHLVLNGYSPSNITILAAYLGQFFLFRKERKAHLDLLGDMRIAVLDNYQGEESDIILLSLVRNNDENKIGFLSIENRVCVAVSRARNGMYIMGNMAQLCHESKLWRKIKENLEEQGALGTELPLRCQIHQDQVTLVKTETDFLAISEGGCKKKCEVDLACGHQCASLCHVLNRRHLLYKCQFECKKKLCDKDESHLCKKMCFEECGPCTYLVPQSLPCGHNVSIECHINLETYKCRVLVTTTLPCGHPAEKPCFCDPETFRCPHICDVKVEPCGHACERLCHVRRDPDHSDYKCEKPCAKFQKGCTVQEEEHRCKRKCYQECDECNITVRKQRTVCPHLYDVPCSMDVDELECEKPCTKVLDCGHKCASKCNEQCQKCQIKVLKPSPICGHPVQVRCCDPPIRDLCYKKCPLKLPCGHPCLANCNQPCTTICTEMVDCEGVVAECGHIVTKNVCNVVTSGQLDPKLLVQHCEEPCNFPLQCGHPCSGSCGECFQGRIHKKCGQKCGAVLVCDHQCGFPCRQACRPCKKACSYRCQHSICRKTCGEVCTPCKEPCTRRCKHQKCRNFCGDFCSVPPCMEPCRKPLKCGHPCVGFCGDVCPPKCMVCDKDELLEIFFGSESEDSRFVYLNDCKHIVESTGMERWLQENDGQISYKVCPMCKTAIKTTQRYSDYIKRALRDVAEVKMRSNGKPEELKVKKQELAAALRRIGSFHVLSMFTKQIKPFFDFMSRRLVFSKKGKKQPEVNIFELHAMKSKLQILQHVISICDKDISLIKSSIKQFYPQIEIIIHALTRDFDYISDQEIRDIAAEVKRLSRLLEYCRIRQSSSFNYLSSNNEEIKLLASDIERVVYMCKRFTDEDNENLIKLLKELNDLTKSGIGISEMEKMEILSAMGFSKGHWYKCPNGHIYAIGECGGAMQEATCNECGARIGGSSHRLLASNAVATEMDGARYGAWSENANMLNYDIQDLEI